MEVNVKDYVRRALFRVEIKNSKGEQLADEKDVDFEKAVHICNTIWQQNPLDFELQDLITQCMKSFGFMGSGRGSGPNVLISAYLPLIDTGEVQTCPRRMNEFGPWKHEENLDTWKIRGEDKCCSFCGSVHPERVIELVKQHGPQIIQTTDKGYKFYISRPEVPNASFGGIKTYLQHWSEDQVAQYNAILHTD